jgi:hypothetical protein
MRQATVENIDLGDIVVHKKFNGEDDYIVTNMIFYPNGKTEIIAEQINNEKFVNNFYSISDNSFPSLYKKGGE